jgi:hypothetical protein
MKVQWQVICKKAVKEQAIGDPEHNQDRDENNEPPHIGMVS